MSPLEEHRGSVTIVVVCWNGRDLLGPCLGSLREQTYAGPVEIVVVDNCSTDGSAEFVEREFPEVRLIRSPANNYAAANNLGAASSSSEYIVCLNTDTRVEPDWLDALVSCAETDPRIGVVGSLVLDSSGRIASSGIDPREGFTWVDRQQGEPREAATGGDVFGVSGCAVLYRRACWDQVGGLDEDFHMYYEDVDMSLRCRAAGWRIVSCPRSVVHHECHASIEKADRELDDREEGYHLKDRLGERNRLFVIARHYPRFLAEHLPTSRFVLEEDPDQVRPGLELVFSKWSAAPTEQERSRRLVELVFAARRAILERERWARGSDLETALRDQRILELLRAGDARIAEHEREKRALQRRILRLEDEVRSATDRAIRARQEAQQVEMRIAEMRHGYEAQIARDREELSEARVAYEREIAHRDRLLAELRARLAQLESAVDSGSS